MTRSEPRRHPLAITGERSGYGKFRAAVSTGQNFAGHGPLGARSQSLWSAMSSGPPPIHCQHCSATGGEEPPEERGGEEQEDDVEPCGVVPGGRGLPDVG